MPTMDIYLLPGRRQLATGTCWNQPAWLLHLHPGFDSSGLDDLPIHTVWSTWQRGIAANATPWCCRCHLFWILRWHRPVSMSTYTPAMNLGAVGGSPGMAYEAENRAMLRVLAGAGTTHPRYP